MYMYTNDIICTQHYITRLDVIMFYYISNPTPEPVSPPGEHDPLKWLNYTTDDYNYAYLSRDIMGTYQAYRQHQYAFWREYIPYLVLRDEVPSGE